MHSKRTPGGKSGKTRITTKKSKKRGCKATLVLTCYAKDMNVVHVEYRNNHTGHVVEEDAWCLPRSDELTNEIEREIMKNYDTKHIHLALQKKYAHLPDNRREANVHTREITNLRYKYMTNKIRLDSDDFLSAKKWLQKLESEQGFAVWGEYDLDATADNGKFAFGFMSPWQYNLLKDAQAWGLDATHHIGQYLNAVLYTVVVRVDTGNAVPVAYLFTNDQSATPLKEWLYELKERTADPDTRASKVTKVTIDASLPEDNALTEVLGEGVSVQYCTWHVKRAWTSKIQHHVKTDCVGESSSDDDNDEQDESGEEDESDGDEDSSYEEVVGDDEERSQIPARVKAVRVLLNDDLGSLMQEADVSTFQKKLKQFKKRWQSSQPRFWGYFNRYWLAKRKYKRWAKCYQPAIYTNMETNNYVESWHKQLKYTYLRGKRNQRYDELIYILVEVVQPDLRWRKRVHNNNVGPASPEERFYKGLEIKAVKFLQREDVHDPVQKVNDQEFKVPSFEIGSTIQYSVST